MLHVVLSTGKTGRQKLMPRRSDVTKKGKAVELMEGAVFFSAFLAQSSCREENKSASEILFGQFLIYFFFCSYESCKSNTAPIKIKG